MTDTVAVLIGTGSIRIVHRHGFGKILSKALTAI